jgi:hypothetical protein
MPQRNGQSGQTLLQLMITLAIMGILGVLVAKLTSKVGLAWVTQQLYSRLDFGAQSTRRLLTSQIRDASAASVIITRVGVGQPLCSKVAWIDASGSSRTVYQVDNRLYAADWTYSITATANVQTVVREGLKAFAVYYPNSKDMSKIAFNLIMSKQVFTEPDPKAQRYRKPASLIISAEVELKNP